MKRIALGILCAVVTIPSAAQTADSIARQFQNPAKQYRPMVRW